MLGQSFIEAGRDTFGLLRRNAMDAYSGWWVARHVRRGFFVVTQSPDRWLTSGPTVIQPPMSHTPAVGFQARSLLHISWLRVISIILCNDTVNRISLRGGRPQYYFNQLAMPFLRFGAVLASFSQF